MPNTTIGEFANTVGPYEMTLNDITVTHLCNILQILMAIKRERQFSNIKKMFFSYFCSKHALWVHVRTVSTRRF